MKLNKAQLAALAAGATQAEIAALASVPDPVEPAAGATQATAAVPAAPAVAAEGIGGAAPAAAPAVEAAPAVAAAAAAPSAPAAPSELVAHLTGQLTEANAALLAAKVEAESFKAQAASVDSLVTTLRAALGEKLVALGSSADAAAGFTATNIAAEYSRIDTVFKAQFRVGGVAAVPSPDQKDTKAAIDPMLAEAFKHSLIK